MNQGFRELAAALGLALTRESEDKLGALGAWLATEGTAGGGLGPRESSKVDERHLTDSLAYATGWLDPPHSCFDLGAGVGLPGLVLAVMWPETMITLVDRSQRRCDLARRAARATGISVHVLQSDIGDLKGPLEAVVSRAAVPAARLRPELERLLSSGGKAVVSGDGSVVEGFRKLMILDRDTRLLMMQKL